MKTIELNVKQSENVLQPQNAVIDDLEISLRHSKSLQIIACDNCSLRHHSKPINRLNAWWQETTLLSESALQLYLANCMITTDSSKTPRDFYNYFFIFICNRPRQSLIKWAPGWVVYSAHIRFVQCELRHSPSICNYSAISLNFRQIFWLCMFFGWFNRWSMKEIFSRQKNFTQNLTQTNQLVLTCQKYHKCLVHFFLRRTSFCNWPENSIVGNYLL